MSELESQYSANRPGYQVESESESEIESNGIEKVIKEPVIDLTGCRDDNMIRKRCVFLIGEAGERMSTGIFNLDISSEVGITVDGVQVGSISQTPRSTLIFLTPTVPLVAQHPLATFLLDLCQATVVTIISNYHSPSYIFPSTPPTAATILYLASYKSPSLEILSRNNTITHFSPPNLVHGLPAALLTVSSLPTLRKAPPTLLLLLPTTAPPPILNPSLLAPYNPSYKSTSTAYDAGGPTALSDNSGLFVETSKGPLSIVANELEWIWWDVNHKDGVRGYEWVIRDRKSRKKELEEQAGAMYI